MRFLLPVAALLPLLAGCGADAATKPTATPFVPTALSSYRDPKFGFSFQLPKNWTVPPRGGHTVNNNGLQQYVVDITLPRNEAGLSVTVDGDIQQFPKFPNGRRGRIPGDPHTYVYFHRTVSQWPAMRVERYSGATLNEIDTIVNTRKASFDVRMITSNPPFSSRATYGYDTIIRTLKLPFS